MPSFFDPFAKTPKHREAANLLGSDAKHVMLYGGARSGKSFIICYAIIWRGLVAPGSRHAIFRKHFNGLRRSIIDDTMPAVAHICFNGLVLDYDHTNSLHLLPNGSKILYGGLGDKERTEKILGTEYATIYLNECSEIAYDARNKAITRLAQTSILDGPYCPKELRGKPLRNKAWYDCNPPHTGHWTYGLFKDLIDPSGRKPHIDMDNYASMRLNPIDNLPNLPPDYIASLEAMPEAFRKRFLLGEFVPQVVGALWTYDMIQRINAPRNEDERQALLDRMKSIDVAVDPSGCSGPEDTRSDEIGILVCGKGYDGIGYVLEDLSGHYSPEGWGKAAVDAYDNWQADLIVGEQNYGGDMVRATIQATRRNVPFKKVTASRGKHVRAEPISALYADGKIKHVGSFVDLENQMMSFSSAGYMGDRSPDRADAMVWALTELMLDHRRGEVSTSVVRGMI
jgi:phage terminase large subunit-like protein